MIGMNCCCDVAGCRLTVETFLCSDTDHGLAGASVTATSPDGETVLHGTTDSAGRCTFEDVAAGDWQVVVTADGYCDSGMVRTVSCPGTTYAGLYMAELGNCVLFTVTGCPNYANVTGMPLPGAVVKVGGVKFATGEDGVAHINMAAGTYPYEVSHERYDDTATGTIVINDCNGSADAPAVQLTDVADGYHCSCVFCGLPLPDTIHIGDSDYGPVVATYDPANHWWGATGTGDGYTLFYTLYPYVSSPTPPVNGCFVANASGIGGLIFNIGQLAGTEDCAPTVAWTLNPTKTRGAAPWAAPGTVTFTVTE